MQPLIFENRSANISSDEDSDLSAHLHALQIKLDRLKVETGLEAIRFCGRRERESSTEDDSDVSLARIEALEREVTHASRTAELSNSSLQTSLIHWLKEFRDLEAKINRRLNDRDEKTANI